MREIKFRAWTIVNNDGTKEMLDWEHYRRGIGEWIGNEEDGVILMQYTGLKDKNGKEIYEGDILRYNYHQDEKNDIADIDFLGEVVYDTGKISTGWENDEINYVGFLLKGGEPFPSVADIEVIGNIYENPELLNK